MSYRGSLYSVAELGIEPDEYVEFLAQRRIQDAELEEDERAAQHFPHLSPSVAPRESDETPTFWED